MCVGGQAKVTRVSLFNSFLTVKLFQNELIFKRLLTVLQPQFHLLSNLILSKQVMLGHPRVLLHAVQVHSALNIRRQHVSEQVGQLIRIFTR